MFSDGLILIKAGKSFQNFGPLLIFFKNLNVQEADDNQTYFLSHIHAPDY